MYVTGLLLIGVVTGPKVEPLNSSVVFLKETDVVLTSDEWRIMVNIDLGAYEEVASTIKADLLAIQQQKKEFTPVSELKQIETLLENLEDKLHAFHQVLPRPDSKRGLLNFGGTILKTLFGTAVVADIHTLHDVLDELRLQNSDISHSLSNQLTYVKNLSTATKLGTEAVANLSNIVKDHMIRSHDQLQKMAGEIMWLNVTIFGQSALHGAIRQLEFTLLQLVQQIDDLIDAVQLAIQGTLSIKLINPVTLQNILRNVTLQLPQGYELIVGTKIQDIHTYYDLAAVSVVDNAHCVNIVLNVPLKSANRHFTLFRIVTLPTQITSDKFAQFQVDYDYFGLQHSQRGYILLTEASYNHCKRASLTICPADTPVYSAQTLTCEASLFFQNKLTHRPCKRKLLYHQQTPFLHRYGAIWIFYFPTRQQVSLHCRNDSSEVPRSLSLFKAGTLHDTSDCYVTSSEFQTLPELRGTTRTTLDAPKLYVPDNITVVTEYEAEQLQSITPTEVQQLIDINARMSTLQKTFDMDALLHIHQTASLQQTRTFWSTTAITSVCAVIVITILCLSFYFYSRNSPSTVSEPDTTPRPSPRPRDTIEPRNEDSQQRVVFASYSTQPSV